ncbi:MAG: thioredoxin family protein, partial [Planctomycetota bacterium]
MKCQLSRSSSLNSKRALACCSTERDFQNPPAAAAMSSETLPKSASGRAGRSTVMAATAISERPATAPTVIPHRRMFMSPPGPRIEYCSNYAPALPLFRLRVDNRPRMIPVSFVLATAFVVGQDMGVDWRKDYETARAESREKGRLLLLHFHTPGRPLCKAMDEETFANAEVARAARERFVSVR